MKTLTEGVYAAAITPRRQGMQDINLAVMWDLIDFLCERKVAGITLLGATGEFVHFSSSERMKLMALAPKRSRVPVIINVSHSTLDGAVELADAAVASGAAGLLLMPPYFFRYSVDEIRTFYQRFQTESDLRDVPLLIYNIPQFGNGVPVELALELIRSGVVQGIKDSSGDWQYMSALIAARRETPFRLYVGNDSVFARAAAEGIDGVISGCACAVPELLTALDRAVRAGKSDVASTLEGRLAEFIEQIDRFPTPVGVREAACQRGIPLGPVATPASEAQKAQLSAFREWFNPWLKTIQPECKLA